MNWPPRIPQMRSAWCLGQSVALCEKCWSSRFSSMRCEARRRGCADERGEEPRPVAVPSTVRELTRISVIHLRRSSSASCAPLEHAPMYCPTTSVSVRSLVVHVSLPVTEKQQFFSRSSYTISWPWICSFSTGGVKRYQF